MHPNAQLIEQFYSSFSQRNYAAMIACYAPAIQFSDAVFTLNGKRAGAMWHMLCESGKDLEITSGTSPRTTSAEEPTGSPLYFFGNRPQSS